MRERRERENTKTHKSPILEALRVTLPAVTTTLNVVRHTLDFLFLLLFFNFQFQLTYSITLVSGLQLMK